MVGRSHMYTGSHNRSVRSHDAVLMVALSERGLALRRLSCLRIICFGAWRIDYTALVPHAMSRGSSSPRGIGSAHDLYDFSTGVGGESE